MFTLATRSILTAAFLAATLGFAAVVRPGAQAQTAVQPSPMPSAAAVQTPDAPEDVAVTALAKEILAHMQAGKFDRTQFSADYSQLISDRDLASAEVQLAALGEPLRFRFLGKLNEGEVCAYAYRVTLEHGKLDEFVAFDGANKIVGLMFHVYTEDDAGAPTI